MKPQQLTTLVLDLGNVILPLNITATYQAFEKLGARETLQKDHPLFHDWERGTTSPDQFLAAIRGELKFAATDASIWEAWHAMLLSMPEDHIWQLKMLRKQYRLVLLSNINHAHEQQIKKMMGPFGYSHFLRQFHAIYYSHHVGMRKPDAEIFKKVLKDQKLKAAEVLFVDDTEENIRAAEKLGISCFLFNPEKDAFTDLDKVLSARHSKILGA